MRILHTSDWHLGHAFFERPRLDEQAFFLDWLLEAMQAHAVDALVVAGDVFDSPTSPNEAFELYYRFLARLSSLDGPTRSGGPRAAVVVGGNHDSPGRLDAPRHVLSALETHVVGGYDPARAEAALSRPEGVLVPLAGAGGQVGLVVAAVPFLNDWRIGVRGFDADPGEQRASMHARFREVYARLADQAAQAFPGVPVVATGHLTCLAREGDQPTEADGVPAEINRVGTLGAMGPSIFDPRYAYVALGHIHRGFQVDAGGRVRYSGTPVQVGSVEPPEHRRVLLVDVDGARVEVTPLAVPCRRRLKALSGSLDEVRAELTALTVPEGELPPYVSVRVGLSSPEPRLVELVRQAAAANRACAPVVLEVQGLVARRGGAVSPLPAPEATQVTPEAAFRFAWQARYGRDASPPDALLAKFRWLLEQAPRDGA
ncbi:MAG: exonuclease subunit SbcD [Myxococcaceae bacterium]|nr:exonuclease subunit SbcD [Myxococcaceae bacterium]MCA3015702.1 exonuclease subunit SbcD [Myxococcaceae bacterium]